MNKLFTIVFALFFGITAYAQTVVSGTVTDASSGQPIPGANLVVVGTTTGTSTDFDGKYSLTVSQAPPFTIQVSSVGYESMTKEVTQSPETLDFALQEGNQLDEVVVSASRTPERIFESPVTVERFGIREIKNTASADFYDGLENLKGVDINTNSLTFKSINARGFATFANNRFMQLVDGMDNSSPALNFPIGNLVGMIETDVKSVELLPGASSALYGANAFNGILFMTSKNPFDVAGISAYAKAGFTQQEANGNNPYHDFGIRAAYKFSDKFAAKINFGFLKGVDWGANNLAGKPGGGATRDAVDYDGMNVYGDEVSTNIRAASGGLGIIPDVVVSRTGYNESDLTNYSAESIKTDWGLYFRPWANDFEIAYVGKFGTGNTIYQGTNRYNIANFWQQHHKLEVRNDNFFVRGYVVADNAGDSYDMVFTGININRAWKSDTQWFGEYIATYAATTFGGGTDAQAHAAARAAADTGRFLPGTPEFQQAFNQSIGNPDLSVGSKFQDESRYYHGDANYNFSHLIEFADIQVGGSYRKYRLNSSGTIYTDADGPIRYSEFGAYTQIQKNFELSDDLELKLTGSARYDKSEFFDGFVSPRLSAGFTINNNHNIRASVQTGFRNPTTQDLFIGLDAGRAVLVGGAPDNLDRYSRNFSVSQAAQNALGQPATITQTGRAAYENSFLASSVSDPDSTDDFEDTGNPASLRQGNSDLVEPEKVTAIEVGYRAKINKITIDLVGYFNKFEDFISNEFVIAPYYGSTNPSAPDFLLAAQAIANGDFQTYQTYTNSQVDVESYGATVGVSVRLLSKLDLSANYTYTKQEFDQEQFPDFRTSFNTPEHKVKMSLGSANLVDNIGFNVAWRWSDDYFWQATFSDGDVPAFHTLDAQINFNVPKLKSTIKFGGTNLLGQEYFTAVGTGLIGSQYYVSWIINN